MKQEAEKEHIKQMEHNVSVIFLSLEIGIDRFSYYVKNNNNVIYKDLKEFTDGYK